MIWDDLRSLWGDLQAPLMVEAACGMWVWLLVPVVLRMTGSPCDEHLIIIIIIITLYMMNILPLQPKKDQDNTSDYVAFPARVRWPTLGGCFGASLRDVVPAAGFASTCPCFLCSFMALLLSIQFCCKDD